MAGIEKSQKKKRRLVMNFFNFPSKYSKVTFHYDFSTLHNYNSMTLALKDLQKFIHNDTSFHSKSSCTRYAPLHVITIGRSYKARISILEVEPHIATRKLDSSEVFQCNATCDCINYVPKEEPTTEKWTVVDDDIFVFVACNVPKIASDVVASPYAHFSDGLIDV